MRSYPRLAALLVPLLAVGCPGQKPPPPAPPPPTEAPVEGEEPVVVVQSKSGLGFRLTEVEPSAGPKNKLAKTVSLSDEDAKKILDRLPAFDVKAGDEKDFALRDRSQPPPKTGKVVSEPFPPPAAKAAPKAAQAGPLKVLRHLPEGDIKLAPHLSVTFSQPMVPVTSHGDLAAKAPPVKLSPTPPGKWRWVGTQTLLFEPEKRFPMATDYEVEVPAGTRAEGGGELGSPERWRFSTPPPHLDAHGPDGGSVQLDPLMYVGFDQAVDPEAILAKLVVRVGDGQAGIRLATADEIEDDRFARSVQAKAETKKKYVFFKAREKLPANSNVRVVVPKGTPSAEGPKTTDKEQHFFFHTFGPMKAQRAHCSWAKPCPPLTPFRVDFSNPIEESKFDRSMVRVEPAIEGMKVVASYNSITISGRTKGRTKYKITLAPRIPDKFGQTMAEEASFDIQVDSAEPTLFPEERMMAVLDPEGTPSLPLYSINHKGLRAKLYAVSPGDWEKYREFRNKWDWEGKRIEPPGKLVATRVLQPKNLPDELVETPLDLSPALRDGVGQVLVVVEPTTPPPRDERGSAVRTWLQVTKLGVDVFADQGQAVAWISSLGSGAPVAGAEVSFLSTGTSAATGGDGLAQLSLDKGRSSVLVARKGADLAFLHENYRGSFHVYGHSDQLRWLVFDDRKTYKPGEEARLKGFLRVEKAGKNEDIASLPSGNTRIEWRAQDARGVEIGKGKDLPVSAEGGFDFTIPLPKTPNLGATTVILKASGVSMSGNEHYHSFQIEEFRRPEFEVNASVSEGPHKVGRPATLTVAAKYYAGGGLGDAPVQWHVTSATAHYSPPNRPGFHFGQEPWGWWRRPSTKEQKDRSQTLQSATNGQGEHRLRVDFEALEPSYPMTLTAEATVTDVNRQAWTSRANVLVHPGDHYVGVRPDRGFVKAGESLRIDGILTDVDGKAVAGRPFTIKAARLEWEQVSGEMKELEKDPQVCELTSAAEPVPCALTPKVAGQYRITAMTADTFGRKSQTEQTLWVFGEGMVPDHGLEKNRVQILSDRSEYGPGSHAELLVFAPFAPAEGVVSLRRQGIVHLKRFSMKSRVETVTVPIEEGQYPAVEAAVSLVGSAPRENLAGEPDPKLPPRPAYASGQITLKVPPKGRRIDVKAKARDEALEPGGNTTVDVELTDAKGSPVAGAEVAVAIVDEAILALGAYKLPDPLDVFYSHRSGDVAVSENRSDVLLGRLDERSMSVRGSDGKNKDKAPAKKATGGLGLSGVGEGGGGLGYGMGSRRPRAAAKSEAAASAAPAPPPGAPVPTGAPMEEKVAERDADGIADKSDAPGQGSKKPITQRSNFNPLAAFVPGAVSDGSGKVTVAVKLPDSLTRYRIMAVAAHDRSFGEGEGSLVARLPLMVRPSAPRFLNFGDQFDFPIVVQNQTSAPIEVDLVARAANALLTGGSGRRFSVPANDRVEVRLPVAALRPGTARFQLGVASGRFADASTVELPVWTPATTEAFATYGQIDDGAISQAVKMPTGVVKEFGGLEISTSSTALSALTDAVLYLVQYPYDCNEQISSRILAIAALRDVLSAFKAPGLPSPGVLVESMNSDLTRLRGRQHWNGGFSFWGGDREPWPYLSAHVMHAIARAKEKGYKVPEDTVSRGLNYLRNIESHYPWYYGPETRRSISSYALYTRHRLADKDPNKARKLLQEAGGVEKMPIEALGWLLPVLGSDGGSKAEIEAIHRFLANRVSETAGAAHFVTSYSDGAHVLLHSDRRADGVLLESLIGDQPSSDLIPKLVAGLLNHRKAGRWYNTQENAFILLALDRYFNTYEKATPDFVARAWLGDRFAGEHAYRGRSTDKHEINIPMRTLAEVGEGNLVVQKDGPGRLYYRVGMQYAPSDLRPPPAEHGFTVTRVYEPVERPDDVKRDDDGTWRIKAGAKVRVRVAMVAPGRRYHVALVDPLPAGLEPMNPSLAVTGSVPQDPKEDTSPTWWWSRSWYEHQNMRDERVEAFTSLLYEGIYDYSYVARATTPGSFVVPPPKAEEMYAPETFGRGAGDRVIIE